MRLEDLTDFLGLRRVADNPLEVVRFRKNRTLGAELRVRFRDRPHLYLRGGRSDYHMFHRIFRRDEYRLEPLLGADASAGPRLGCVVDLGGNVGVFSARVAPHAERVIVCEPVPENFARLQKNLAGFEHVQCLQTAVSDRRKTLRIHLPHEPKTSGVYTSYREGHERLLSEEFVEVPALGLADLLDAQRIDAVDLLKIDVEGAEYDILYPAADVLPCVRRIHGEYHDVRRDDPRTRIASFSGWLREQGYAVDVVPHARFPNHGMFFAARP